MKGIVFREGETFGIGVWGMPQAEETGWVQAARREAGVYFLWAVIFGAGAAAGGLIQEVWALALPVALITFLGLKRSRSMGTKVWPKEPVPPVISMELFLNIGCQVPLVFVVRRIWPTNSVFA